MSSKKIHNMGNSSTILDRIMEIEGISTDVELAKILDTKQNTLSNWRKRDSIPYDKIIQYCDMKSISLDFIFKGQKVEIEPDKKEEVDLKEKVRQLEARMILIERILSESKPNPGRRFYDPLVAEKK